jgi:hypothetical protein
MEVVLEIINVLKWTRVEVGKEGFMFNDVVFVNKFIRVFNNDNLLDVITYKFVSSDPDRAGDRVPLLIHSIQLTTVL